MRSLPLKKLFAHYAPYLEYTKNPEDFASEDDQLPIGTLGLVDNLSEDERGGFVVVDFVVHPHIESYERDFKRRFRSAIDWKTIENNLIKRIEDILKNASVHAENIRVGIEGETDEGMLACVALIKSPTGADVTSLCQYLTRRLEDSKCIHCKCRDPKNKRYITMQVGGFFMSTLDGGNWRLREWDKVASRMAQNVKY